MSLRIRAPEHAGARDQAQELVGAMATALDGREVILDCSGVLVATPSFLDEIVKQVLVVGGADKLHAIAASERVREKLERAAGNRKVAGLLVVEPPAPQPAAPRNSRTFPA